MSDTTLVATGLDRLLKQLVAGPRRVWLASPFLGADVGVMLAEELDGLIDDGITDDVRVLTCLTEESLRSGYTSPIAVRALVQATPPGAVRTLGNLHRVLCEVLMGHPKADARVHAAWRLTVSVPPRGVEPATVRALVHSYSSDPALVVRRNARRALARLRHAGAVVITGRLHEPSSLDEPAPRVQVRRVSARRTTVV